MAEYAILERLGEGIVVILRTDHRGTDSALWSRAKLRTHKTCPVSGRELHPGDLAYSPTGNTMYRYERIDAGVVDRG